MAFLCTAAESKFHFLINEVLEMISSDKHIVIPVSVYILLLVDVNYNEK
jgi:hypothetical protein